MFGQMAIAPVLQGLGTALIPALVALARDRDAQTQAAASAEVRALQSRMDPHFLFNALNTLAAQLEAFFAALREGRTPTPGPEDALETLRLAVAATKSWREGRPVKLSEIGT